MNTVKLTILILLHFLFVNVNANTSVETPFAFKTIESDLIKQNQSNTPEKNFRNDNRNTEKSKNHIAQDNPLILAKVEKLEIKTLHYNNEEIKRYEKEMIRYGLWVFALTCLLLWVPSRLPKKFRRRVRVLLFKYRFPFSLFASANIIGFILLDNIAWAAENSGVLILAPIPFLWLALAWSIGYFLPSKN